MDIVQILGTGVSGFSFLMLFVGYRLTSSIQGKILDANLATFDSVRLKVWSSIAERQLANTRYFMLFSVVFLLAGLTVLIIKDRPVATILLAVTPAEAENSPLVYAQEVPVKLVNGRGKVAIRTDQGLTIQNDALVKLLAQERIRRVAAEGGQLSLAQQSAAKSKEAGFGFSMEKP
jgi:hypothetical protein